MKITAPSNPSRCFRRFSVADAENRATHSAWTGAQSSTMKPVNRLAELYEDIGVLTPLQLSTEFVQQSKAIGAGGIRIVNRIPLRWTGHFFTFHGLVEQVAAPELHV